MVVNYCVCRVWIYRGLASRHPEYPHYATPLRRVYDVTMSAVVLLAIGYALLASGPASAIIR